MINWIWLTIVGCIIFFLGMILDDNKNYKMRYFLILVGGLFFLIGLFKDDKLSKQIFRTEKTEIVIQIEDKKEDRHFVGIPGKGGHFVYDYYVIWDDEKTEVSKSIYDNYNIGDTIIVTKTITYKKQDDGTEIIQKIEYN